MKPLPGRMFEATDVNLVIWKYYFFRTIYMTTFQHFRSSKFQNTSSKILNCRSSQPFGTRKPPNHNCIPFAYPQIKNSTQMSFFWVVFKILRTPCELLTYPRLRTAALLHVNKKSQNYTFEIYYICWLFRDINITTPQCLGIRCCVCVATRVSRNAKCEKIY
jgi:hypothetical protein